MVQVEWDPEDSAFQLSCGVVLPAPRTAVFSFFSDAFQLEQITPQWLNFKILTPAPIVISAGTLIDYRIRLRGIPIRWRTEISSWDPPYSFTDRQLRGPYRLWEHLHTFEEVEGGTLTTDRVRYQVPGGRLVNWLIVGRDLKRIFEYRQRRMLDLFAGSDAGSGVRENSVSRGTGTELSQVPLRQSVDTRTIAGVTV